MNILVTLNAAYVPPLKVMLRSLFDNCSEKVEVYLMHSDIEKPELMQLSAFVEMHGHKLYSMTVDKNIFADAPVNFYYPPEMYYRLIAHTVLPEHVDRILYLDPDILVLNPIESLYYTDLDGYYFAAAAHSKPVIDYINRLRLRTESNKYYNSGVLLINVELMRKEVDAQQILDYIQKHAYELILPDQDVLNGLFWNKIKPLDEYLYNYDARRYRTYLIATKGRVNLDFVIHNTVILHFCGRQKPWHPNYRHHFGILYKHYQKLVQRMENLKEYEVVAEAIK
ncbi:lipopolysaccharide biosynthesis glycosyltransferase [Caldicoprobacter guelmensis]|uniref:glycosyltransferase family 8 protein n=1 Tax=Caldicoprobacter guelmensis TaxID=1170224 RepID=UPI00311C9ED0|nr:lipopolysaccharide biosynthesis glycosyltransferase [Caldicoprobacter guelmensis]